MKNSTYNADYRTRNKAVVNGTTTHFVLDDSMFVRELRPALTGGETNLATYLVGPRGPEYRRDDANGGIVRWYVYDALGSVLEEVSPSGNVTSARKYDVYGATRGSTGTATSKHRLVGALGHPSEDETGLIYMQARYMDPAAGRFISEDPGKNGENWFAYCGDNPTCRGDRTGRDWQDALLAYLGDWLVLLGFWILEGYSGSLRGFGLLRNLGEHGLTLAHLEDLKTLIDATVGLLYDNWQSYRDASELVGGMDAVTRLMGYDLMFMGQMLLTMADIENPGAGDWWGWTAVGQL